jgi:hypothetical protein
MRHFYRLVLTVSLLGAVSLAPLAAAPLPGAVVPGSDGRVFRELLARNHRDVLPGTVGGGTLIRLPGEYRESGLGRRFRRWAAPPC